MLVATSKFIQKPKKIFSKSLAFINLKIEYCFITPTQKQLHLNFLLHIPQTIDRSIIDRGLHIHCFMITRRFYLLAYFIFNQDSINYIFHHQSHYLALLLILRFKLI